MVTIDTIVYKSFSIFLLFFFRDNLINHPEPNSPLLKNSIFSTIKLKTRPDRDSNSGHGRERAAYLASVLSGLRWNHRTIECYFQLIFPFKPCYAFSFYSQQLPELRLLLPYFHNAFLLEEALLVILIYYLCWFFQHLWYLFLLQAE